jgi:hypothetical protein
MRRPGTKAGLGMKMRWNLSVSRESRKTKLNLWDFRDYTLSKKENNKLVSLD